MKLGHGKKGREALPFGKRCHFVTDGQACNLTFPTQHFLRQHKLAVNHYVPKPRGGAEK